MTCDLHFSPAGFFEVPEVQVGAPGEMDTLWHENYQRAKKVVSDSPRLVDFAVRLVNSVLNLPKRQVKFFGKLK